MFFLYQLSIRLYILAIQLASFRSKKAAQWIQGRKNQHWENIRKPDEKWVWFHCASLGEFEQGRPVIEALKKELPHIKIVLSFFSPSGFEVRKNYPVADSIIYLPADLPANVNRFLQAFQPELAVIVKYEFWFGYLRALKEKEIPTYLISARFRKNQHFFQPWGFWFRKQLACFTEIHVQDKESEVLLHHVGYTTTQVSGDSRYDRVAENASYPAPRIEIENWIAGRKVLIAGSTWSEDDEIVFPWNSNEWAIIVAPHEISEARIEQVEKSCGKSSVRYTQLSSGNKQSEVLILDNMGMLLSVYALGDVAYVGGAFGKGLHNILEPAACGLPVIFGPKYSKFLEAEELIQAGGGFSISNRESFLKTFSALSNPDTLKAKSALCASFVQSKTGATQKIIRSLVSQLN
ncbi:MAG TPA: glycosyltransferase N-terminal domain-containing protein [Flavobacteriales bacterium]|nr:glycosyltransferase N-terminal domain-containing protein [Flavobacteriales bacterium]